MYNLPLQSYQVQQSGCRLHYWSSWLKTRWRTTCKKRPIKLYINNNKLHDKNKWWHSTGMWTDLFWRSWAQVLVSLQKTFTESRLIRYRLHSGKSHLTLVTKNSLLEYSHCCLVLHVHICNTTPIYMSKWC